MSLARLSIGWMMRIMLASCMRFEPQDKVPPAVQQEATQRPIPPTHIATMPAFMPSPSPTPPYGASAIIDDFIFTKLVENCELPCWNGIQIGTSGPEELATMFEAVFGFIPQNGYIFDPPLYTGYKTTQYSWRFDPNSYETDVFWLFIVQDKDEVVQGLRFSWAFSSLNNIVTVQRIFQELGEPSQIWVSSYFLEGASGQRFDLIIVYDSGVAFNIHRFVPMEWSPNLAEGMLELCLGGERWGESEFIEGEALISAPPTSSSFDEMTTLQSELYGYLINWFSLMPIETVFDITPKELTEFALAEPEPCLNLTLP